MDAFIPDCLTGRTKTVTLENPDNGPESLPPGATYEPTMFELHEQMTKHLFPTWSSEDERFLALALCGEAGELGNLIKKRWRDGTDHTEAIRDEIADIRVYLELLAKKFGIEGHKLDAQVKSKLKRVAAKHGLTGVNG